MARSKKYHRRDISKLTGKPLSETLRSSSVFHGTAPRSISTDLDPRTHDHEHDEGLNRWVTSPDLTESNISFPPEVIKDVTVFLLENINLSSSALFRADILFDSWSVLKTPQEKSDAFAVSSKTDSHDRGDDRGHEVASVESIPARQVDRFELKRTVVRRLIPRNPNVDRVLEQTCHFYEAKKNSHGSPPSADTAAGAKIDERADQRFLVIYTPHLSSKEEVPYYHPLLRAFATIYDFRSSSSTTTNPPNTDAPHETEKDPNKGLEKDSGSGSLSLHILPFPNEPISTRLERTLNALLSIQIHLARTNPLLRSPPPHSSRERPTTTTTTNDNNKEAASSPSPRRDNLLPQHLVQDTYSRLKRLYAPPLCKKWVEKTEPTKHVFEDLAIAAFLIELWRSMYGVVPGCERRGRQECSSSSSSDDLQQQSQEEEEEEKSNFPGFVDIACGNGVLVYVLLSEGYSGWGFDARRRKTWGIFPPHVQDCLKEEICIPRLFAEELGLGGLDNVDLGADAGAGAMKANTGTFERGTFIVSNHADELTLWTPILAKLSGCPFLAIPCCSHALSGCRWRFPPQPPPPSSSSPSSHHASAESSEINSENNIKERIDLPPPSSGSSLEKKASQPETGDLLSLRKTKKDTFHPDSPGFYTSTYGALAAKTAAVAAEVGFGDDVEMTKLRIPSTRNMGVLGGRKRMADEWSRSRSGSRERGRVGVDCTFASTTGDGDGGDDVGDKVSEVVKRECAREGGVGVAARIWVERARGLHVGQGKGGH